MTFLRFLTLSCCLWTFTPAESQHLASSEPNANTRARIVILGDSLTAGYGLDPGEAYPALLQAKINAAGLPFEVVNAGISGDTTSGGLRRVDWILAKGVDILIVALGGNDGLRGIAPAQTARNLADIIDRARTKRPKLQVILAGMQMPDSMGAEYVGQFREMFPKLAAEKNATLIPLLLEGVGGVPELNQPDLIHPNAAGQKRLAENVWRLLAPLLRATGGHTGD
jgi:acyl-CoA thioesterase-1